LWHPDGILFQKYGHRVLYDAASHFDAKVDSVRRDKQWVWNAAKSDQLVDIQSKLGLIHLKDSDNALWDSSYKFNYADI
jgi:hypothetical protein